MTAGPLVLYLEASMKVPPKDGKGAAIAFVVVKGMPQ